MMNNVKLPISIRGLTIMSFDEIKARIKTYEQIITLVMNEITEKELQGLLIEDDFDVIFRVIDTLLVEI